MHRVRSLLLASAMCLRVALPAGAQAPLPDLAELDRLQTLSQRNSAEALQALQASAPRFANAADADTRRTYLAALTDAAFETGQAPVVAQAIAQLKDLAAARNDVSAQVLATCFEARQLAVAGKTRAGLDALAREAAAAEQTPDLWVRWLYHLTLGALHSGNGQFEEAMTHVLRSLELSRTLPRQAATAELRSRTHLELLHFDMKNPDRALQTIRETLPLAERLDARQALGWLHLHRGNVENVQGNLDTAVAAYRQALQIARAGGLTGLRATALNNLGDVLLQRKAYAEAEPVMREALAAYRDAHELNGAALAQANLGFALMGQGRVAAGVHEVEAGIRFAQGAGSQPLQEQLLGELSRMYEQAGLYREAIETTRKQQALAKDLFHTERDQAVAALQERFDSAERQRQIEQLAQANRVQDAELRVRRMQQIGLAAAVALALLAAGASFRQYRRTRASNQALAAARRLAEDALAEKNLFLATASHDLRQPVHAMSLMVEAIGLRNSDPVLRPLLADLCNSMQAMNQLFNALLDLSRLESGQPLGAKGAVDLNALLADVVRLFREQASMNGLALRLRLPRVGATVWAEPVLLRQALVNLVQNAIRYTPQGKVLVSVRSRGDDWLVEVRDTGIGIAAADQDQVFNPYYRGDRGADQAGRMGDAGHGLGLAVVARCAEQMGATYGLQSRTGRGSRFWLRLPAQAAAAAAGPSTPAAAHPDATAVHTLQGRCLVLDDDRQVLKAWRAMLDAWGVTAAYATTAAEAHAWLDDGFEPDAIFCDQRLRTGDSGFDVLRSLLARHPAARGAMVSGEFEAPALREAEDEGYLVLRKPVNPAELHAVLARWLERSENRQKQPSAL
ncbi:ATP-binding protein [Acidovorax sp. sic0104]|uniref:ATP-binding protein n=1 Tax=Acidovorax sp. sic0104 TaxID=2854784 RepID=UPI001C43DF4B|nr:ATP-binding protein [Acidovorax sp. sic0104]MBV7541075.1 tetratricopeptide repeat protein [Acidovorax sp. sic0104]